MQGGRPSDGCPPFFRRPAPRLAPARKPVCRRPPFAAQKEAYGRVKGRILSFPEKWVAARHGLFVTVVFQPCSFNKKPSSVTNQNSFQDEKNGNRRLGCRCLFPSGCVPAFAGVASGLLADVCEYAAVDVEDVPVYEVGSV